VSGLVGGSSIIFAITGITTVKSIIVVTDPVERQSLANNYTQEHVFLPT
jgi:hypothetical protein